MADAYWPATTTFTARWAQIYRERRAPRWRHRTRLWVRRSVRRLAFLDVRDS